MVAIIVTVVHSLSFSYWVKGKGKDRASVMEKLKWDFRATHALPESCPVTELGYEIVFILHGHCEAWGWQNSLPHNFIFLVIKEAI